MTSEFKINIETIKDRDNFIYYKAADLVQFLERIGHHEVANIIHHLKVKDETENN